MRVLSGARRGVSLEAGGALHVCEGERQNLGGTAVGVDAMNLHVVLFGGFVVLDHDRALLKAVWTVCVCVCGRGR